MKKGLRALSLLLSVVMLSAILTGCYPGFTIADVGNAVNQFLGEDEYKAEPTPLPSPGANAPGANAPSPNSQSPSGQTNFTFSSITYERPDFDAIRSNMYTLAAEVPGAAPERIQEIADYVTAQEGHFDTLFTLVMLKPLMDGDVHGWEREEEALLDGYYSIQPAQNNLARALQKAGFSDTSLLWYATYLETQEPNYQAISDLENQEALLLEEYDSALYYDGEDYTTLGNIYIDLAKVRWEIARLRGFDSAIEMYFHDYGRDYTPEMAYELIEGICNYVIPVVDEMYMSGYSYLDIYVDFDEMTELAYTICDALLPEMRASLDTMFTHQLYDVAPSYNKDEAFVTYFFEYDMPFLSMSYEDDFYSVNTFLHEFGHFHAACVDKESFYLGSDLSEVHSQGMELLCAENYSLFYVDEVAAQMRREVIAEALDYMVWLSFNTACELLIYNLPPEELTLDRINTIVAQMNQKFGYDTKGEDWVTDPEFFFYPTYDFSYVTSYCAAFQIWSLYLDDPQAALDAYRAMIYHEPGYGFLENVQAAGLASPFSQQVVADITADASQVLFSADWNSVPQYADRIDRPRDA